MAITQNTYTGNGSTTNYSITFEYLKQADVKATLDGTATTAFTFANATTLSFNSAPANGAAIRIFRDTDITTLKATFFPGSAIKAEDLNDNFTQNNFASQETDNEVVTANATANTAKTTAEGAVTTANSAVTTANSAVTTANSAVTTANTASTNASAAVSTANTASTNASNAVTTANTASTNASNAVTTANSAATDAATAISTANSATTTANAATTAANAAQADANTATSTANSATTTANTASTNASAAVTTANTASTNASNAVTTANSAVATANAASQAVSAAAFFQPIAALANLPSSPSNEDRVEVVNSTGVESSSAVSGVPSGFVGSSDLTVRLQYNSSTSKWVWSQYFATDPENRYAANYLPVIKGDGSASGQVGKITLNCSNNNHGVSIQSPPHSAGATYGLTLPTALPGSAGQALTSDTSGNLSFADLSTADGSITTAKLADDAVTAAKLADTAVTAGTYTTADITVDAQGRITSASSGTVANVEILDGAVSTAKIADDAVTAAKLADTSVTAGSYTSASITVDAQGRITSATSGSSDKIIEGNTEAEVVDTGSDGHFKVSTEGSERLRVGPAGQVGIGGTNYGTSGQVLTSGGASAAPTWSNLPPAAGTIQATASGALADGDLVAVNTNGTVSAVTQTTVAASAGAATNVSFDCEHPVIIYFSREDKYLVVGADRGDGGKATAVVMTIAANGTKTYGTKTVFQSSSNCNHFKLAYNGNNVACIMFMRSSSLYAVGCEVTGNTLAFGSVMTLESGSSTQNYCLHYHAQSGNEFFVTHYGTSNISSYYFTRTLTPSATGPFLNPSSQSNLTSNATQSSEVAAIGSCYCSSMNKSVVFWYQQNNDYLYYSTFNSHASYDSTRTYLTSSIAENKKYIQCIFDEDKNQIVVITGGPSATTRRVRIGTPQSSNTEFTWGTTYGDFTGDTHKSMDNRLIYNPATSNCYVVYQTGAKIKAREITPSGTGTSASPTIGSQVDISPSTSFGYYPTCSADKTANNRIVNLTRAWDDPGFSNERSESIIYTPSYQSSNSDKYIGVSNAAYANGATATIQTVGSTDDAQSGLTPGSTYYVTPTGTLSTTAGSPSVVAGTALAATKLIIKG